MAGTLSITEAVDKFVNNIKKKYKGRRIIQEEQLLGCRSEKLVRLELVKKKRLQASKQRGNKYGSEDSSVTRTPLAYADLFKVEKEKKAIKMILIDGDAGIGKTTFCIAVCEDWADGKIFQEFKLVLLLPLREQEVASAGSLFDLLKLLHPSPKVCDLVEDYFEEDEGSILIVADGWDELGKEKRDKGTFLYKLLFGSQYSSVSTIVTSRPSASASLHHGKFIDRFAEICGFDKEHIVEYISSEFADDQAVASDILEKLESNPLVESICSIPLNCAIICHLWQILKVDFPTTMTGLYTKVILHTILRSIRKPPDSIYKNIKSLPSFYDLPETLQQSWWLLCEFAFQTLKEDKLVFSDKELRDFFPQGLSLDNDILCFSLLQSSVSMLEVGCGTSFHFLHLTFQEYLAALFLVKQKCCEVAVADSGSLISGLTNLFEVPLKHNYCDEDSIVLRFFFGIAYTFEIFQNSIGQRILTSLTGLDDHCLPLDFILCHWAFEAHNDQFVRVVIDKLNGSYTLPSAVHDFAAVAYVIAKTPECTDKAISLRGFDLRDYHLTVLTDILSKKDGNLQVRRLDLNFDKLTDRVIASLFNRAASAFQSLCYLGLNDFYSSNNMIDDECINPILATLAQSLNEVVFSFKNKNLDVPSLKVFRDALYHHQLSNLTELRLTGSLSSEPLANAEFIQALGHCRGLKVLDLSSNNLCAPGGKALGKILPQLSLEKLEISYAKLGDEGMFALNQGLERTCHIGCLNLGKNDIHAAGILCLTDSISAGKMVIKNSLHLTKNPLDLKGAEAVVRLLSNEHFLADDFELSYCELTTAEDDSSLSISPHVGESSMTCAGFREWVCGHKIEADGVKTLGLPYSNFSGEGIHVLAGFMHLCPHLRSLGCGDCNITSNDLKQLLSLLSQSNLKNLEWWSLYYNYLDDDGVSVLIEHLSMFPSLTSIIINENSQVSSEMCKNLEEICEKRRGKIAKIDLPMLDSESEADTDVSSQCSILDSVKPIITEPHSIHQEVQKVTTVVAEEKVSHGQNEDSSDDERHISPPSTPAAKRVKLQEDESKGSISEARATLEDTMSSLCDTSGLGGEGPQLGEIISAVKEITDPYILGVQLGIEPHELGKIEKNYPRDIDRQMAEVLNYWLCNSSDCSWGALASAVEKMGGHGNLVKELGDKHLVNTTTAAYFTQVKLQEDESKQLILEAILGDTQSSFRDISGLGGEEPHPIRQEVQKVRNVVAEGKVSHEQTEDSSDENYITSPAAKRVKLQEDESKQFEIRAALGDTMSSLSDTSGPEGEGRSASVAGKEIVDQLPPTMESGRTATPGIDKKICHTFKFPPSTYYQCSQTIASVPFLTQVEILTCDSSGCEYYNSNHGITLRIPGDAIPPGMVIHLEVAVALYGPFQFPDGSCPISPILWLCVQENVDLRKPIDIILPHFLTGAKNFEISFAKADHKQYATDEFGRNRYVFQPLETSFNAYKERDQNYGILSTQHCCYLCIISNDPQISPEFALKAGYYLWCIEKPSSHSSTSRARDTLHFCATFCLPTCREILKSQYTENEGYYIRKPPKMFTFRDSGDTSLSIEVQDIGGCVMSANPRNKKIKASQISYWDDKRDRLELLQRDKVYPPSVTLTLEVLENLPVNLLIKFNGSTADDDMNMEIMLPLASAAEHSHAGRISSANYESQWSATDKPELSTLLGELIMKVDSKWENIGILLKIEPHRLESIKIEQHYNTQNCLREMLKIWLNMINPPPSWSAITNTLERLGEQQLARDLRSRYPQTHRH